MKLIKYLQAIYPEFVCVFHRVASDVFLILNVLLDGFKRSTTNGRYEIRGCPECRKSGLQRRKFSSQDMRRYTFDVSHRPVDSILRVYFHQEVYMVWHDFHFDYIGVDSTSGLLYQLLQPLRDFIGQYASPIFRTPNHMILAWIDYVMIRFVFHVRIIPQRQIYFNGGGSNCMWKIGGLYPHIWR